jgi:hypothetical protein
MLFIFLSKYDSGDRQQIRSTPARLAIETMFPLAGSFFSGLLDYLVDIEIESQFQ